MGQSPSSKNYTNNSSDHILVQGNADMKNGHVEPRVWTTQITKQAKKGDLILSVRAPVGDIGKTDYDVVIGRGVAAIKGNEYIFQVLIKMKDSGYWTRFSTGSTFESINSSNIRNAQIMIPKNDEQTKIAKVLTFLDNTIQLHERKCEELALIKKALLQKLFPKKDKFKPEVRYKNFSDAWEQRKLGEVVKIQSGFTGDSQLNNGKFKISRIETISNGVIDSKKIGFSNTAPNKKYKLKVGDILYSNINSIEHIGKIAKYIEDIDLYHGINLLRLSSVNENSSFLFYELNTENKRNWAKSHANKAVNQASINQTELKKQRLDIPSIEEQNLISNFLIQLDSLITLHQRKLEKLKQLKKFLLQNMFI